MKNQTMIIRNNGGRPFAAGSLARLGLCTALWLLLAAGASMGAWASNGRVPVSAGGTITAAGSYYLTEDITASSGTVITIGANDVTLDLNGHTITVPSAGTGIYCAYSNSRITNGHVVGGQYGVYLDASSNTIISARVDHMVLSGQTSYAIRAEGVHGFYQVTVEDNTVASASHQGIRLYNIYGGALCRNRVTNCGSHGILVSSGIGLNISGNTSAGNGQDGMFLQSCDDCAITANTSSNNGYSGFDMDTTWDCRLFGNTASKNSSNGFNLSYDTWSSLDQNLAGYNSTMGFAFSSSTNTVYGFNRALGNTLHDYSTIGGTVVNAGNNF